MEWTQPDFERCLQEFRPQIESRQLYWNIIRNRYQITGRYPTRLAQFLIKWMGASKPYYIGATADGVLFLGDIRDSLSVAYSTMPGTSVGITEFVKTHIAGTSGAYLEVGANMGVMTAAVARACGEDRTIYAFEPILETAKRAAATFALNKLTNITLYTAAVGDEEGQNTFHTAKGHSECASTHPFPPEKLDWEATSVPCVTLDCMTNRFGWGPIGFMNIQAGGDEPKVVRGATQLIEKWLPKVLFNNNLSIAANLGWKAEDVVEILPKTAHYDVSTITDLGNHGPFPPTNSNGDNLYVFCNHIVPIEPAEPVEIVEEEVTAEVVSLASKANEQE